MGVLVRRLPESFFLFILLLAREVDRIFQSGFKHKNGVPLAVRHWDSWVGNFLHFARKRWGRWILIKGLPIHLWCGSCFKVIGDMCGGFVRVDENWGGSWEFVRILVKNGGNIPAFVDVDSGKVSFRVQLIEDVETVLYTHSVSGNDRKDKKGIIEPDMGGGARIVAESGKNLVGREQQLVGGRLNVGGEISGGFPRFFRDAIAGNKIVTEWRRRAFREDFKENNDISKGSEYLAWARRRVGKFKRGSSNLS